MDTLLHLPDVREIGDNSGPTHCQHRAYASGHTYQMQESGEPTAGLQS